MDVECAGHPQLSIADAFTYVAGNTCESSFPEWYRTEAAKDAMKDSNAANCRLEGERDTTQTRIEENKQ